ncbi:hypothetical protein BTH42_23560 [Burkholderia sp. SRS-W-2-2016]|nr:hypothetical protein BTH42_23560 [Burkholderia sp. SRS-W-2-2016]
MEVIRSTRQILSNGVAVRVSSRAYELLELLLDANGALVSTADILRKVWPDTIVEENNIQVHISALRRIFGAHRQLIQTVSGRGYRLVVPNARAVEPAPGSAAHAAVARPATPATPDPARRFRLPDVHGPLFGRDPLLHSLAGELERNHSLITLVGAPGSGKSRIAIELAHRQQHRRGIGTAYLSLAAFPHRDDQRAALDALLGTMNCVAARASAREPLLIVLDNCDLSASCVIESLDERGLFSGPGRTTVLATCRAPLNASMEKVVYVDSLLPACGAGNEHPALDLFVSRVRALDPDLPLTDAFIEQARELVAAMDGLPLAIEFAARHTSLLGIDVVTSLLQRNLPLPAYEMRGPADSHHASFDAALRWTWAHFSPAQQTILRGLSRLGRPAGPDELCALGAAHGLPLHQALDAISALVDSAFVFRLYDGPAVEYRIPNTIRRFVNGETSETHAPDSATSPQPYSKTECDSLC